MGYNLKNIDLIDAVLQAEVCDSNDWNIFLKGFNCISEAEITYLTILVARFLEFSDLYDMNILFELNTEANFSNILTQNCVDLFNLNDYNKMSVWGIKVPMSLNGGVDYENIQPLFSEVRCVEYSTKNNSIVFKLNKGSLNLYISGREPNIKPIRDQYSERILIDHIPIKHFKKLLNHIYQLFVEVDPNNNFFIIRDNNLKKIYEKELLKYPKLLKNEPEAIIHKIIHQGLKLYCDDTVKSEVQTEENGRYDVWIQNKLGHVYVIEIKWMGDSISKNNTISTCNEMNVRNGAAQVIKYIDNKEKHKLFLNEDIHRAILYVLDARPEHTLVDLEYAFNASDKFDYLCYDLDLSHPNPSNQKYMYLKKQN